MRTCPLLGAIVLLVLTGFAGGGPVQPFDDNDGFRQLAFEPFSGQSFTIACRAKERTCAIVYGFGSGPMAVYVFDAHGNCVAWDDVAQTLVSDDLATEWYPPTADTYVVEFRNLGRKQNNAEIAIR